MTGKQRFVVVLTAVAIGVVLGIGTTVVLAGGPSTVVATGTGTDINRVKTKAAEGFFLTTDPTSSDGPVIVDVPGAVHRLVLTGETLVVGRFQALAGCSGGGGVCRARIEVRDNSAGDAFVANMQPDLNNDWDGTSTDHAEVGVMERSITLPAGDYDFQVVVEVVNFGGSTTFNITDWHYTIERIV